MPRARRQRHTAARARKFLFSHLINRTRSSIIFGAGSLAPDYDYLDLVAGARSGDRFLRSALKYLFDHITDPSFSSIAYKYGSFSSLFAVRNAPPLPSSLPVARTDGISQWVEWVPWIPPWHEEFPLSAEEPDWLRNA
jgi:hypothetical protein